MEIFNFQYAKLDRVLEYWNSKVRGVGQADLEPKLKQPPSVTFILGWIASSCACLKTSTPLHKTNRCLKKLDLRACACGVVAPCDLHLHASSVVTEPPSIL